MKGPWILRLPPRPYHTRRNGYAPIAPDVCQIRVVERIIFDRIRPAPREIGAFLLELPMAPIAGRSTEARTFVVKKFGMRCPDYREAGTIKP
jgi:hypothetical protein